jgi:hypothetical protein
MPEGALDMESPPEPWQRFGNATAEAISYWFSMRDESFFRRGSDQYVAHTEVVSRTSRAVMLTVSLPAPYRLWLNGREIGGDNGRDSGKYTDRRVYEYQQHDFDVRRYPVQLRAGRNHIEIQFTTAWYHNFGPRYMQVGFADLSGRPLGCTGRTLNDADGEEARDKT